MTDTTADAGRFASLAEAFPDQGGPIRMWGKERNAMQFMVIETFKSGRKPLVYERFQQKGRMLPDGLKYLGSWVERDGDRCFQLMETENEQLFDEWTARWDDLVDFEIIPVTSSPAVPSPQPDST